MASRLAQIKREYERKDGLEIQHNIDRLTSRIRSAQALLGEAEK